MSKIFQTKVDEKYEFTFSEADISSQDMFKISKNKSHLLTNFKSENLEVISRNFLDKTYQVKINSKIYKVQIKDDLDLLINKLGLSLGKVQIKNEITSPMPGLILEINVNEGQEVKEGDSLLILEAMKMENNITATFDATVKGISVKAGQSVAKNELLIEFE